MSAYNSRRSIRGQDCKSGRSVWAVWEFYLQNPLIGNDVYDFYEYEILKGLNILHNKTKSMPIMVFVITVSI